jgi:hypothetical protein
MVGVKLMAKQASKSAVGLHQQLSSGTVIIVVALAVGLVALVLLFMNNPFRGVPPAPKGKPAGGGPVIPAPLGPDMIRHGPIGR